MTVLVVCSGNICRSPMAAEYLRHRASREGLDAVVVTSGGLLGIDGEQAAVESIAALAEVGLDLRRHRSRGVTPSDVRNADLVVAMTSDHVDEIRQRFPETAAEIRLLRAFEDGPIPARFAPDLADPVGKPLEAHRAAFQQIRDCVDHLTLYLKHRR